MQKAKTEISCGIIPYYIHDEPKILIVRSTNHWGFPKGHQEAGESVFQTATRELLEETGLKVRKLAKPILPLEIQYDFYRNNNRIDKVVYYFLGEIYPKKVELSEEELIQYKWVSIKDLAQYLGQRYFNIITYLHQHFGLI